MHSSRMHTVCCSGHLSCHACPPTMHTPCHTHTTDTHTPATHAPIPHHAHPSPFMPLAMHTPTTQVPCDACPLPCTLPYYACPPAMYAPPPHTSWPCMSPMPCIPPPPVDRLTDACENNLSATAVANSKQWVLHNFDREFMLNKYDQSWICHCRLTKYVRTTVYKPSFLDYSDCTSHFLPTE